MPVGIPRINIGINKFFLSLPIQRRYIEYLISFMVSSLKCLLHLQNIYLEGKTNNKHGNHPTEGDVHSHLPLWQHLVLVEDLSWIELMLLNSLNYCPLKAYAIHGLGRLWNLWTLKGRRNQSLINKVIIEIKWWEVWQLTSIASLVGVVMLSFMVSCKTKLRTLRQFI